MMRKLIILLLCLLLLFGAASAETGFYAKAGRIIEFNPAEDEVFFVDGCGLVWCFEGIEDWDIGDIVAALMWDSGTPEDVLDDLILDVEYAGEF